MRSRLILMLVSVALFFSACDSKKDTASSEDKPEASGPVKLKGQLEGYVVTPPMPGPWEHRKSRSLVGLKGMPRIKIRKVPSTWPKTLAEYDARFRAKMTPKQKKASTRQIVEVADGYGFIRTSKNRSRKEVFSVYVQRNKDPEMLCDAMKIESKEIAEKIVKTCLSVRKAE